jgi:DNA-binding MarR family transcriptional regulator
MNKDNQEKIKKIRNLKKNDHTVNLYILLDQTDSIVTNAIELELKHLRITQPQIRILTMLSRQGEPVTLEQLSNWTLKEFNSVSTLINRMEKKGLVKKTKKGGDLRTYVNLTEKGSKLYHLDVTERSVHLIFENLSNEERMQLRALLMKVRDATREIMGFDYKPPFMP